jgi:Alpha-tubulin suppressor and related RCC1 domain-containing proteins
MKRLIPICIDETSGIVAIACGRYHSMALLADGTVWAWGYNNSGQLGIDSTENAYCPEEVHSISNIKLIACGDNYSFAVTGDGVLFAWGSNAYGGLGDNTNTNRSEPVEITYITDIIAIDAGNSHTMALKSDGTVWTWGGNALGQLGDGTTDASYQPIQISGLTDIQCIAAGYQHSLALLNDGTVKAWGDKERGQTGTGSTGSYLTSPTLITGMNQVKAIASGDKFSHILTTTGDLYSFGYNYYGQLGNNLSGAGQEQSSPIRVHGMYNINELNLSTIASYDEFILNAYLISDMDGDTITMSIESGDTDLIPLANIDIASTDSNTYTFSTSSTDVTFVSIFISPEEGEAGFVSLTLTIDDGSNSISNVLSYTIAHAPEIITTFPITISGPMNLLIQLILPCLMMIHQYLIFHFWELPQILP